MEVEEKYKTRAIVAHVTLIGWIVALVQNGDDKNEFSSFYIRQMLGLVILGIAGQIAAVVLMIIPFLGWILALGIWGIVVGAWIMSLIGSINGKKEPTPFVGHLFQQWFSSM